MRVSQYRRRESSHRSPRWSAVAFAAASLLLIQPTAQAAGFGALHVRSSLGQPLQADIDLTGVTAEEVQNLSAKLAAPDAYARAGLSYNPIVSSLRASLERQSNGNYVVRLRSTQPVAEPFVDVLVDLNWASGHVSRAYTFLLDPVGSSNTAQNFAPTPVVQATTPGAAESSAPAAQPQAAAPAAATSAPARQSRQARQAARQQPAASTAATAPDATPGGSYTVQRGDSLYDIASTAAQGQDAVSLDQMLLALYRNNPNAFIGGNINRLRTGSVLKVPSQADAQKTSPREARREVVAQTSGFAGYRNRLATAAEANAATDTDSARQQSGSVSARVQDQATPAASGRDELRLSKADRTGKAGAAAARDEEIVAKERALKEMESRVAQLEKNLADMQHLVELKNAELAKAANAAKPAAGAAPSTAAPAVAAANAPAPTAAASSPAPAQPAAVGAAPAETAATPASSTTAATAASASAPLAAASAPTAAASVPVAAASAPAAVPKKKAPVVVAPQPPIQEESFFSTLLGNPMALGLGGLVVALLGGLVVYRRRQQKPEQGHGFQDSLLSQESTVMAGANSLFGAAGGQSVDTSQHSVFGADFRIGGGNESNEVDPIAEADVYIAYGRDVQAEEILREALEQHPERQAIRLKLMEIYANRQDAHGFQTIAEEMLAQVGAGSPEWAEAAAMGRKFDPANPLYLTVQGEAPHPAAEAPAAPSHAGAAVAGAAALAGVGAAVAAEVFSPTVTGQTTRRGDDWTTLSPDLDPSAPSTKAPQLADLELPLESFPAPAAGEPITAPVEASDIFKVHAEPEAGLPEFNAHAGEAYQPVAAPPLHMDLSDLSLDLNPTPPAEEMAAPAAPAAVEESLPSWAQPADLSQAPMHFESEPHHAEHHGEHAEVANDEPQSAIRLDTNLPHTLSGEHGADGVRDLQIKFDLAKAYIEIGDKEGARELLQEVLDLGDPAFHAEAQALMRQIG